jgi:murein L,D-transpeptidase YcbB/YkuD
MRCLAIILASLLLASPAGAEQAALRMRAATGVASSDQRAAVPSTPFQANELRALLSSGALSPSPIDDGKASLLRRFYEARGYAPLWLDDTGLTPVGAVLFGRLTRIAAAGQAGIASILDEATHRSRTGSAGPELELLLSAALVSAAIDPSDPASVAERPEVLSKIAAANDVEATLRDLLPVDPGFWRLRAVIQTYRRIAAEGGWPRVPAGPKLEMGVVDARVEMLRLRLLVTGDLAEIGPQPQSFDATLDAAVRGFQARHGLEVDGIVGKKTLAALNVAVEDRLTTMEINLRRLQHREWGQRYLAVNAAAASYRLVDGGRQVFERVAIVGRPDWPTPELDSAIDRLEFNPYWVVPPRIAKLEVLPRIGRDSGYMRRNDMHWVDGQIRQNPGPRNPLGKVKFLFPNPYSVYLHDTNNPRLFDRWDRFLSHGCIRVAAAAELAKYLLKDDLLWPVQRIDEVLRSGRTLQVRLAAPVPLHIVYDTAWVDEAGIANFREDVYVRDTLVVAASEADDDRREGCAA